MSEVITTGGHLSRTELKRAIKRSESRKRLTSHRTTFEVDTNNIAAYRILPALTGKDDRIVWHNTAANKNNI